MSSFNVKQVKSLLAGNSPKCGMTLTQCLYWGITFEVQKPAATEKMLLQSNSYDFKFLFLCQNTATQEYEPPITGCIGTEPGWPMLKNSYKKDS